METKIVISVLLLFYSHYIIAQNDNVKKKNDFKIWGNIGISCSFDENKNCAPGYNAGINFGLNNKHFIFIKENKITGPDFLRFDRIENAYISLQSTSLMYGFCNDFSKKITTIYSTGISYNKGKWIGSIIGQTPSKPWVGGQSIYEYDDINSLGIPLCITFLFKTHYIGFSIDIYANFNKHPDYGIGMNFHFGKIGKKKNKFHKIPVIQPYINSLYLPLITTEDFHLLQFTLADS